jgi:hypothetical protein
MANITFKQFKDKFDDRADKLIRAVGIKTFSAIIRDTPVGNPDLWKSTKKDDKGRGKGPAGYVGGRLRANWNCSLGMPDTSTDESTEQSRAIPGVVKTCETANRHSVLWLSNSLPYAHRIEYDGHSRQAPAGMVRRNVTRIRNLLAAELRKLKS